MKLSEFDIGTEFQTATGQRWRCTDVGRRTILAIELDPELDEAWLVGPPFAVPEVVFDEIELEQGHRSFDEAVVSTLDSLSKDAHPGYPSDKFSIMMDAWLSEDSLRYPRPLLFRIDRIDTSGEILHPYAAEEEEDGWVILVYLLFPQTFSALPERDFIRLRAATEEDLRKRRDRLTTGFETHG